MKWPANTPFWTWPPSSPWTWPPGRPGTEATPPIINDPRLALHLESDFGVTVVGGKVSEWASRAGWRNTVVQANDANRPTLVPNVLNGKPAIRFSGGQWLQSLAQLGVNAGDYPRLYVLFSSVAPTGTFNATLVDYEYGSPVPNTLAFDLTHYGNNAYWNVMRSSFQQSIVPTAAGSNNVPALYDGRNGANTIALAVNGIEIASSAASGGLANTPDRMYVGRYFNGAYALAGDIFQIIVLTNPTPEMHQFVLDYLANKYPSVPIANTPAKILGSLLHADFDAADSGIVLDTGRVASIPSRGADGAAMVQGSAQAQPAFSATSFAGGPGITFDGVNDGLLCTLNTPIPIGRRPYMWVVYKANNLGLTSQIAVSLNGNPPPPYMVVWSNRADGNQGGGFDVGSGSYAGVPPASLVNRLDEVGLTVGGTDAFVINNAKYNASAASSQPLPTPITYIRASGYNTPPQQNTTCTLRRIIVANDMPSAAQISAMRAYLRAQPYGLTF